MISINCFKKNSGKLNVKRISKRKEALRFAQKVSVEAYCSCKDFQNLVSLDCQSGYYMTSDKSTVSTDSYADTKEKHL
jgi:hypothetical protein